MQELSRSAKLYISSLVLVGMAAAIWQLSTLPGPISPLYLLVLVPAVIAYFRKTSETVVPHQQTIGMAFLLVGLALVVWQMYYLEAPNPNWVWLGFSALAAGTHILKQEGPTGGSSYQISFMVYGFSFVLLGTPATVLVIIMAHLFEYAFGSYYPWYIQAFNTAILALSMVAAGLVRHWVDPQQMMLQLTGVMGIALALVAFTVINHWLVGMVLKLARGQSFAESGVFGYLTLMIDFSMLCLGAGSALLFNYSPFAVVLGLIPLYLIYSTLRLPALERQSETDAKTGVYNARYFMSALKKELDRAHRFDRPLTVVLGDLDLLRNINNTYGHLAGDVVIMGIAQVMSEVAREYDLVARFGGEEFALLMPETTPEEAWPLVEAIRLRIEGTEFAVSTSVAPIGASMSFGIAGRSQPDQSSNDLIHCADVALYQAKAAGRNLTRVFGGEEPVTVLGDELKKRVELLEFSEDAPVQHHTASSAESSNVEKPLAEAAPTEAVHQPPVESQAKSEATPRWLVNLYVGGTSLMALSLALALMRTNGNSDWLGLLAFVVVALMVELNSVEIYVKETVVSTSAAPLLAGSLLFGPVGAIILGVAAATATYFKNRTGLRRFVFNASNFITGNLLSVALITLIGEPITALSPWVQLAVSMFSAVIIYVSTTLLVAGAIQADTGRSANSVWKERFRWLGPYYMALGIVAFALIFCYLVAGLLGVFIILVPLLMLRFSQKQYIDHTETLVNQLRQSNAELVAQAAEITLLNEELLLTLARSVDLRDPYVLEHSRQVSQYAMMTAEELGLSAEQVDHVRKAGLLHDIGKLGISEAILFKPARLTGKEYELVKEHVLIGAELIHGCHSLRMLAPFVRHHHEHYDGGGYPDGLAGEEIPLEARILALADAVEAMASDRPYKKSMSQEAILAEIERCAGAQFDPKVARAFARALARNGGKAIINSARTVIARQQAFSRNGVKRQAA